MAMERAVKELPKHDLSVTVGVHHNQLGTDPMLRRNPLAPGGHFVWNHPPPAISHTTATPLGSLRHRDSLGHILCPRS